MSILKSCADVLAELPVISVATTWNVVAPSPRAPAVAVHLPVVLSATVVNVLPPTKTLIAAPCSAVPLKLGVVSLVIKSVEDVPVSLDLSSVIDTPVECVSIVNVCVPTLFVLPAKSFEVTV